MRLPDLTTSTPNHRSPFHRHERTSVTSMVIATPFLAWYASFALLRALFLPWRRPLSCLLKSLGSVNVRPQTQVWLYIGLDIVQMDCKSQSRLCGTRNDSQAQKKLSHRGFVRNLRIIVLELVLNCRSCCRIILRVGEASVHSVDYCRGQQRPRRSTCRSDWANLRVAVLLDVAQ